MKLSIITINYNNAIGLKKTIESLIEQSYQEYEYIVIDGGSDDGSKEVIWESLRYVSSWCSEKDTGVYNAMNKGIMESRGEVIVRIDAHTLYAKNYFSVLVRQLGQLQADNVGAFCRTNVLNKNAKTLAIREVLSNKLGVGNSVFRTGVDEVMEVDTVPFGCWRREVFDKYGYYDTRLVRNQDIELNKRIIRGGGKIYIVPDTYCTYLARETFKGVAKNNFQNGEWNILTVYFTRQFDSLSLRHFVPMMFVASLILPLLLSVFYLNVIWLAVFSLCLYLCLLLIISFRLALKKRLSIFFLLCSFCVLHVSYGCGSIVGVWKVLFGRR